MRKLGIVVFLLLAGLLHIIAVQKTSDAFKSLPQDTDQSFVLPSALTKIAALEFRGLASDVFFLNSMIFIGTTQQREERPQVKDWEWNWYAKILDTATDLDPYFFDPYFYANAFLPWDAHKVEEANRILEKGSRYRDWDWMLPFYIGFNNFFILHKDDEAVPFLMEASRRPGGDTMLASIAARIAFKENRTETAIFFLEESVKNTEDEAIKTLYETRIKALRSIAILEKGVDLYRQKYGKIPANVNELVRRHIINQLPADPYGGTYSIAQDGKVMSSTSSELEPHISPAMKSFR